MLINFCLLHLQYLGSLRWLTSTASSERATSSLSPTGGNSLHASNWTKCLSKSETPHVHEVIMHTWWFFSVVFWIRRASGWRHFNSPLSTSRVKCIMRVPALKDLLSLKQACVTFKADRLATAGSRVRGCRHVTGVARKLVNTIAGQMCVSQHGGSDANIRV